MGPHLLASELVNEIEKWGNQRTKTKYRKLPGTQGNESNSSRLPGEAESRAK